MSLNGFIEYLVKERNYSRNTVVAYKNDLQVFQNFCSKEFDHESLNTSNYNFIRSWIVSLVESGLSNRSVNRKISALRSYFNFLLKIGEIDKSPLKNHKSLKEENPLPRYIVGNDAAMFMESKKMKTDMEFENYMKKELYGE